VVVHVARMTREEKGSWVVLFALHGLAARRELVVAEHDDGDSESSNGTYLTTHVCWRPSCPVSCPFDRYPEWIFAELTLCTSIKSVETPPDKRTLERIAAAYQARTGSTS
jgi:hypothetical protein